MCAFVVLGSVFSCQAKRLAWGTSPNLYKVSHDHWKWYICFVCKMWWDRDSAGNTVEENSSIFALI